MQDNKIPYNAEAERALINSIITDPDAAIDILEALDEDDFYLEAHRIIYRVIKDLDRGNMPSDILTLTDALEKRELIKKVGGMSYLEGLTEALPSTANYRNYLSIVERDSVLRKLINSAREIHQDAIKSVDSEESLANAEAHIYNISEKKDRSKLIQAAPYSEEVLKKINLAISDKNSFKGIESYFENLDNMLNGLHKSDLMLIAARPSLGKTSFAMNIVSNIILNDPEKVVAVFSLEMAAEQLVQRLIANISDTSMKDAQRGSLSIESLKKVYQANKVVTNSKLYIDDSSMTNPPHILSKCRRLIKREGRLDLLVVDYLQLMVSGDSKDNRQEVVSDFSRRMKIIAKELDVPLILISQLSRAVERREDKQPQLSDLRESGSIEQDADIVMLLHRPEPKPNEDDNMRELIIAKHRNGETGKLFFKWRGESLKFIPAKDPNYISKSPLYVAEADNNRPEVGNGLDYKQSEQENLDY